ncbi:MAG TPA: carboxypeptidase regulatory-like domain-containing protein [Bryobacteraceae bacterium]|jgi:5-hydroxyisourate hydrolase-like protein (transthyretin family)|nr:carboxypeptidase regulatory-like domain-containing protein [Bryobacteraceae bacterium]
MRLTAAIFLSGLALAAQVQITVSGPVGFSSNPNGLSVQQPPTRPEDLCTVEGSVFNATTGTPLKKAAVLLSRTDVAPSLNSLPQSYSTATDAAGNFAIKDIEPRKYRMTVTRNGFVTMTFGARGPNRPGTTLTLERAQKMKEINFRLTPHGVVAGRVVDEDGEPLPFVSVQLVRFQVRQGRQQLNMAGGSGTTNDLGEYRIFGIAPGKYYLRASGQRSASPFVALNRSANSQPEEDYVPTYFPGTIDTANASPIEVGGGAEVGGINFILMKTATVHVKGSVGNLPTGIRQPPQIMIVPRSGLFIGPQRPTFADAKGNFDIRGVAPGQYMLSANVNDDGRSYSTSVPVDVGNSNVENVSLAIGQGVDVAGKIRIEGDGKADLTMVNVNLRQRDASGISFGGVPTARVKDDNTFQLENAGASTFEVTLFGLPDGFYVKSIKSGDTDVQAAGLDITRGAPQPLEVVLSPNAGSLSGAVQNPNTKQPAPGATVVLVPQEKERRDQPQYYKTTTTDQNGKYTLKSLVPGEYKVFAWEDMEPGAYLDPDFLKPVDSKAEAVSIRENDQKTAALTMIAADAPSQGERGQSDPR